MLIRPNGNTFMEDVVVTGNEAYDTAWDATNVAAGVLKGLCVVGERVGGSTGSAGNMRRVLIADNICKHFGGNAISIGGGVNPVPIYDLTVTGNLIDGTDSTDAYDGTHTGSGISVTSAHRFLIAENQVRYVGRSGIRLTASTASDPNCELGVIGLNRVDHAVNTTGYTSPTPTSEGGIVLLGSTCNRIRIIGNVVRNTGAALESVGGISSTLNVHDQIIVENNTVYDDRATKYQEYGVKIGSGGAEGSQPTNWIVRNNDLRLNATAPVQVHALTTTDHGHVI
jgi:hypothetical protein